MKIFFSSLILLSVISSTDIEDKLASSLISRESNVPANERGSPPDWMRGQTKEEAMRLAEEARKQDAYERCARDGGIWRAAIATADNSYLVLSSIAKFGLIGNKGSTHGSQPTSDEAYGIMHGLEGDYLEATVEKSGDIHSLEQAAEINRKRMWNDYIIRCTGIISI